jgi:hypothetical protein
LPQLFQGGPGSPRRRRALRQSRRRRRRPPRPPRWLHPGCPPRKSSRADPGRSPRKPWRRHRIQSRQGSAWCSPEDQPACGPRRPSPRPGRSLFGWGTTPWNARSGCLKTWCDPRTRSGAYPAALNSRTRSALLIVRMIHTQDAKQGAFGGPAGLGSQVNGAVASPWGTCGPRVQPMCATMRSTPTLFAGPRASSPHLFTRSAPVIGQQCWLEAGGQL